MRGQLALVWLIGSVVTGTIALLLSTGREELPIKPLFLLGGLEVLALVGLVSALFLALFLVGWRTVTATWLRWQDPRSVILWTLLVGVVGLAGWGFAAVVTFEEGFSRVRQLLLAYTCGGLPFALVAAMLTRRWQVNSAAAAAAGLLVLTGLAMMPAPLQTLVLYLQVLVGGGFRAM
jgi:hypothetical protein